MTKRRIDVNLEELDQIIGRSTSGPLSKADSERLKTALHAMADRLTAKRTTEKTNALFEKTVPEPAAPGEDKKPMPSGHGRNRAAEFTGGPRVAVPHATLKHGDPCPACRKGKIYEQRQSATLVRIVGRPPLEATVFEMQRLRCNACGQIFTAATPEAAGCDKYDATAVAMIALLKYGTGVPFKRLERLESQLAMPLPAAVQWELMALGAKLLRPVLQELMRQAAQGSVLHNDDTGIRILRLVRETGDNRTGTFTSGIVSIVGIYRIALFFTGPKHAGENIAEVLKRRTQDLPAPIQMCFHGRLAHRRA
jgi:transposase